MELFVPLAFCLCLWFLLPSFWEQVYLLWIRMSDMCLPQQIVWVGEALQQQTENVADGSYSRLGQ